MTKEKKENLTQVSDNLFRLEVGFQPGMRVPGYVYASKKLMDLAIKDNALGQVANVATLPGIVHASLAMPDIHWGYGFVIGGVAAFDPDKGGIVSPGGVGYDINCGVRLIRSNLDAAETAEHIFQLVNQIFRDVPVGVGEEGNIVFEGKKMEQVLLKGAEAIVREGLAWDRDLDFIEEGGAMAGADPSLVTEKALKRGRRQCGTLGAGNHFIEIQRVEEIFDREAAAAYGLYEGMVAVMIHTGSRGLGHQTCEDSLQIMRKAAPNYGIALPDRPTCMRSSGKQGGTTVSRDNGVCRELCVGESINYHQLHSQSVRARAGESAESTRAGSGLRCRAQYREMGDA